MISRLAAVAAEVLHTAEHYGKESNREFPPDGSAPEPEPKRLERQNRLLHAKDSYALAALLGAGDLRPSLHADKSAQMHNSRAVKGKPEGSRGRDAAQGQGPQTVQECPLQQLGLAEGGRNKGTQVLTRLNTLDAGTAAMAQHVMHPEQADRPPERMATTRTSGAQLAADAKSTNSNGIQCNRLEADVKAEGVAMLVGKPIKSAPRSSARAV